MSIFRDTFKLGIQNQLKTRQTSIAARTPAAIQYYNARNAWVRMSSAVNVGGKKDLASKYVLQGGILNPSADGGYNLRGGVGTGNEAYSLNSAGGNAHRLGIRPMPGITGIDIQSKGSYGSLRSVTVSFVAWDLRQLEDLELLYMRPGYTALIEWGWAPYLDNSGNLISANNIQYYDIINTPREQNQIYLDLFKKASDTGNYDAMYGKIQNYNWKARNDGGYDCSTTIVSIGEVIDSLKVNYLSQEPLESTGIIAHRIPGLPSVKEEISGSYSQNIIAGLCSEFYAIANSRASDNQIYLLTDGSDTFTFYKFPVSVNNSNSTKTSITKSGNQIYITLESLVKALNKYVLLQSAGKPYVQLSVNASNITSKGEPLLCLGDQIQISTNPAVCLIANQAWSDPGANLGLKGVDNDQLKTFIAAAKGQNKGYFYADDYVKLQYGVIGNIFVNLDYIYSIITDDNVSSQDKKEKNDISLYTFIKTLMSGINSCIGNVANFDIHVDPTDGNIARIIDVNYVDVETRQKAYDKAFIFEMQKTGPDSGAVIRNYSFESQIFPEQSATIAIASQVQGGALGTDSNTLVDFYKNLTDRILLTKEAPANVTPVTANKDNSAVIQNLVTNLEKLVTFINELSSSFLGLIKGDYDASKATEYSNALKDIINYFKSISNSNVKNRGIIPTKLSFEIDGIGGIVIGNMFRIPDEILPRGYKGGGAGPAKIGFLVTRLGHSIQSNDWITKIDSQFTILDEPQGKNITAADRASITRVASSGKKIEKINQEIGKEVRILTALPGPAANDIPPNVTVDKVIAAIQKKGYSFYANTPYGKNKLNIVGVRSQNKSFNSGVSNYFTDYMVMFYYDESGGRPERIGWLTTAPGLYWEASKFGGVSNGTSRTIMIQEGQYPGAYVKGLHNGTPALIQSNSQKYHKDVTLDAVYNDTGIITGVFGTNIHSSGNYSNASSAKKINNWSAGCQVFRSYDDYLWMMQAVSNQITKTNLKSFNYILLNVKDL